MAPATCNMPAHRCRLGAPLGASVGALSCPVAPTLTTPLVLSNAVYSLSLLLRLLLRTTEHGEQWLSLPLRRYARQLITPSPCQYPTSEPPPASEWRAITSNCQFLSAQLCPIVSEKPTSPYEQAVLHASSRKDRRYAGQGSEHRAWTVHFTSHWRPIRYGQQYYFTSSTPLIGLATEKGASRWSGESREIPVPDL